MATKNSNEEFQIPSYLKFSKIIVWIMYFWVMIGVISLALRTFLLAFSANTSAGFANFVMEVSGDYLQPFRGIFETRPIGETGYLDVSAMFAIIIYLFIAWGFRSLIEYVQGKIDTMREEQETERARRENAEARKSVTSSSKQTTKQVKPRS